eukprot:273494-Pleurochrysis_carterae.AAC.1
MARSGLVRRASSIRAGRSSAAGACDLWKESVLLREGNAAVGSRDVNVEQVGDRSLVLHVPSRREIRSKALVERVRAVVGVQREEVVDVTTEDKALLRTVDVFHQGEDAGIGGTLLETPLLQPREK